MMADEKVAVVTGSNAGIGLSLSERLLTEYPSLHLCLACRNPKRAEIAQARLLRLHPGRDVSIVIIDTSNVQSVIKAAEEIKQKYRRLDYLFLNAGILKISSLNYTKMLTIFSRDGPQILKTGRGILNVEDSQTDEGLQNVFATNLFGHYVLVRELEDTLGGQTPTQIIWTGSSSAYKDDLDLEDIQTVKGKEPYNAAKHATDLISVALNEQFNNKGIYSHTTCPGMVLSNVTFGILPSWLWMILLPLIFLLRLLANSLTCSPYNGSQALVWLSKQKPESLDPRCKYLSCVSLLGTRYVSKEKLEIDSCDSERAYLELDKLYQKFSIKYKKANHVC